MTDSTTRVARRLVLEPRASSAAAARRWIRDQLRDVGRSELAECAELATSELVTNAILHARTTVTVVLEPRADRWRIGVGDLASGVVAPPVLDGSGQVMPSGRGLQILGSISSCWGVQDQPFGKRVWFEPRDAFEG